MRWPLSLLFRGDRDARAAADTGVAASTDAPGAPGPIADPAAGAGAPTRSAAWQGLPAVQRTVGDAPLTAPALPFGRGLAGRRRPDPILRPLAHDVAADGPAGLVSGIATPLVLPVSPIPVRAGHADMPPRSSIQRTARASSMAGKPVTDPVPDEGAADVAAATPRPLPVVPSAAAAPAIAATRVSPVTAPLVPHAVATATGAAVQRLATTTLETPAAPTTPAPGPSTREAADADAGQDAAAGVAPDAPPAPPALQRRTLGESRRLGLGAPLAARPTATRTAGGLDLPLARTPRLDGATSPAPAPPPVPAALPSSAAPAPLPILRLVDARGPAGVEPGGAVGGAPPADTVGGGVADTASASGAGVPPAPARPLVGDPSRRSTRADADAAGVEPAAASPGGELPLAPGTLGAGSGAEWGEGAAASPVEQGGWAGPAAETTGHSSGPTAEQASPAGPAAPAPAPLVVARARRGSGEPLRPTVAGMSAAPAPVVARRAPVAVDPGRGGWPGTAARPAPSAAQAAARGSSPAVAGTIPAAPTASVQRRAASPEWAAAFGAGASGAGEGPSSSRSPLLVARHAASGSGVATAWPEPEATSAAEPLPVARLADGSAPSPRSSVVGWTVGAGFGVAPAAMGPLVQRSVVIDEVQSTVEPQSGGTSAGGSAGSSGGAGGAGQDYEEIADRVYDRIRSRFATELLLDRERMGLLIDG